MFDKSVRGLYKNEKYYFDDANDRKKKFLTESENKDKKFRVRTEQKRA
jgi:hypothetical protein